MATSPLCDVFDDDDDDDDVHSVPRNCCDPFAVHHIHYAIHSNLKFNVFIKSNIYLRNQCQRYCVFVFVVRDVDLLWPFVILAAAAAAAAAVVAALHSRVLPVDHSIIPFVN